MKFKGVVAGYLLGVISIAGCATTFSWPYYATKMPDSCYDQGTLLGKSGRDGWPDLSLAQCKPDPVPSPGASPTVQPQLLKCMTLKIDDFYALKADNIKCHKDLISCERGGPPTP